MLNQTKSRKSKFTKIVQHMPEYVLWFGYSPRFGQIDTTFVLLQLWTPMQIETKVKSSTKNQNPSH